MTDGVRSGEAVAVPWPEPQSLTRVEVLGRLCKLLARVYQAHDAHFHEANDCFCDGRTGASMLGISLSFRHSGQSIAWLEELVERELGRMGQVRSDDHVAKGLRK